jgi:hypothetical protein
MGGSTSYITGNGRVQRVLSHLQRVLSLLPYNLVNRRRQTVQHGVVTDRWSWRNHHVNGETTRLMFSNHKEKYLVLCFFTTHLILLLTSPQNFDFSPNAQKNRHISAQLDYNTCHLLQNIRSQHLDSATRPLSRRGPRDRGSNQGNYDSEDHEDSEDEHSNSRRETPRSRQTSTTNPRRSKQLLIRRQASSKSSNRFSQEEVAKSPRPRK